MAKESDFFQKIIQAIQSEDFKAATAAITGITNEDDEGNDAVFGCVASLFSRGESSEEKTLGTVKQIVSIYNQNKDSPQRLKEGLNSLESKFGVVQGNVTADQELGDLSAWTEKQLEDRLSKLKKEQQTLLSSGKTLDPKAGQQLNKLLEEQGKRLGYEGKKISEESIKPEQNQEERPEGADAWFVTPSAEELASNIKTMVICGSPIIQVLRERYKREYKIKKILDANLSKLGTLSGDEEYEIKRESNRQKDFVSNYTDPTLVLDQDMCAYSIASEFLTDKYTKPELVRIDDNLSYYVFENGALKDLLDNTKVQYSFSTEGTVVGRFAICLNRKEPQSGRFINDAYDIIEFQDGQPVLYFCSAKGVSALASSLLKEIKMTMKNTSRDLSVADPAVAKKMASEAERDKFIQEHRDKAYGSSAYEAKLDEDQPASTVPQEAGSNEIDKPKITQPIQKEPMTNLNEAIEPNPDKKTPQPEALPDTTGEEPLPAVEEYEPLILESDSVEPEAPVPMEDTAEVVVAEPDNQKEAAIEEVKADDYEPEPLVIESDQDTPEAEAPTTESELDKETPQPEALSNTAGEEPLPTVSEYEPLDLNEAPESGNTEATAPVESNVKDGAEERGNQQAVEEVKVDDYEPLEPDQGESETAEPTIDETQEPAEADGVEPKAKEENQDKNELDERMARLEKIVITSAEALDKMEKELSKVSDFVSAVQKGIKTEAPADESSILKRRAEAIKEAIKKKKENTEEES